MTPNFITTANGQEVKGFYTVASRRVMTRQTLKLWIHNIVILSHPSLHLFIKMKFKTYHTINNSIIINWIQKGGTNELPEKSKIYELIKRD